MHSMYPRISSGILLVLICVQVNLKYVNSFSPRLATTNQWITNKRNVHHKQLYMVSEGDGADDSRADDSSADESHAGKIVVRRHLYRFMPTKKSTETKYAIEERQYYSAREDGSLEALGDKSIIFRGEEPFEENDGVTRVGPALYTLQGLHDEKDSEGLGGSVLESCYAMALYCMEHPEIVKGKGLEVAR